jgi:hypothetical protein
MAMDEAAAQKIAELTDSLAKATAVNDILTGKADKVSKSFGNVNSAAGTMVGGMGNFIGSMNAGAQGMDAYSGMVSAGAKALVTLTGESGTAGKILGGLATATGGVTTAIFKQSDALFKSYQDISTIGAAGSSGMQGVFDNMQKFGYSIEELPKFGALLAQSSESLAVFGGTVQQGVKQFAEVAEGIQRSGVQTEFLRLGMSVDGINKGMAGYLRIQTQAGTAQGKTNAELTAGAAAYIREMDIMTKLTGKSAESMQKEQEERINNERYAIHQRELQQAVQRGGEEGLAAAKQLAAEDMVLKQTSGDTKKGFMAAFAGFGATTEEGARLMRTAPEAFNEAAKGMGTSANQTMDLLKTGSERTLNTMGGLYKAGVTGVFLSAKESIENANLKGTAEERRAAAEAEQKKMTTETEASVANQVSIRQNQTEITRGMNSMVQFGVRPATTALEKFTSVLQAGVTRLPGTGDKTGIRNTPGRGSTAPGVGSQGNIIDPEIIKQNQGTINKFNKPADMLSGYIKSFEQLNDPAKLAREGADPGVMAKILDKSQRANQSAAATPATSAPVPVQAATPATTQFSLSSVMANIIEKNKLGNGQYTGPNSTMPVPVGDTTPTGPATAPASSATTTDAGILTTSLNELLQSNRLQQASLEELIDLSRKSLSQNGKLLQVARQ